MTLTFRICTEEDIALADSPFIAAYGFPESQQVMLRRYWALQPDGWWLALLDGKPVGFGGAVDYGAFSSIGMVAVHPSVQRRGIGEALMKQILGWGEARGCPSMVLEAAEKAVSLYRRLGFVEEGVTLRLVRNGPIPPSPLSPALEAIRVSDIADLVAFDAPFFGAQRAQIFTQFLTDYPGRAFMLRNESGTMTGYAFAQDAFLGPWVASTPEDAERLLVQILSLPFAHTLIASIPAVNHDGQKLLERYHFQPQGSNQSMRLGAPVAYRQLAMIYGEASPALG